MVTIAFLISNSLSSLQGFHCGSHLPKCKQKPRKLYLRRVLQASSQPPEYNSCELPDFDRDYYDELKAEYADNPNVRIFSKNDYSLDPTDVPWLYENGGRDLSEITEKVKQRYENSSHETVKEDSDGPPPGALLWTDLHTEEDITSIRKRALTADPVTGKVWSIPMTENELDQLAHDDEIVHYRPDTDPPVFPEGDEDRFWGKSDPPPFPRSMFRIDHNTIVDLEESWQAMEAEDLDSTPSSIAYADQIPAPDPEEYRQWQAEAERRGGNATVADSYDLPPYRDVYAELKEPQEAKSDVSIPLQHDTLVSGHSGVWAGHINIFSFDSSLGERFRPILKETLSIQSDVYQDTERLLNFDSTIQGDSEVFASTVFSTAKYQSSPIRGRAVSDDASYICSPPVETDTNRTYSISSKVLRKLIGSETSYPVVEIGMLRTVGSTQHRHRVIIIANGPQPDMSSPELKRGRRRFTHPQFSNVVFIDETKVEVHNSTNENGGTSSFQDWNMPTISIGKFYGVWSGEALLFQPEYLMEGLRRVKTSFSIEPARRIQEGDVTFVDGDSEPPSEEKAREGEPQQGKQRIPKSVANARVYDCKRLSTCNLLCRDRSGDVSQDEVHAWKSFPSGNDVSWLFSPRIGRFVDNYAGLVLTDSLWLSFPLTKAHPLMWNIIALTEIASPIRRRIVVGRSREGILVGALFAKEREIEGDESDGVATYV